MAKKKKLHQEVAEPMKAEEAKKPTAQSGQIESSTSPKPSIRDHVSDLIKDSPVYVNSVAAGLLGLEQGAILREMQQARANMLRFYKSDSGGKRSTEEAIKLVNGSEDEESIQLQIRRILTGPVDQISWYAMERVYNHVPNFVKTVWKLVKEEASKELESGHRIAGTLEATEWQREPWKRAQFLAIRNGFVEEWKPKGAIELSMIDMMAQSFSEYLYWSEIAHNRSTTEGKILYSQEEERRAKEAQGHWIPPRLGEVAAIDHATQMADRCNRLFLRTLRQLRDLRRYSMPVTINNPAQVNIAADGGQQMNAVKVEKGS